MPDSLISSLMDYVLPMTVQRYCLDSRVDRVEVITNAPRMRLNISSPKIIITSSEIAISLDTNEVVGRVVESRQTKSKVIVQGNPLFPFVSIDSLERGYLSVSAGQAVSAVGSIVDREPSTDTFLASDRDLGIFSIYDVDVYRVTHQRVSPPFVEIGLPAIELIGLRNPKDLDLFELIVNSGFTK